MKFFRLISATLSVMAVTAACDNSNENNGIPDERITLQVTNAGITSRATGSLWEANDRIGITIFDAGRKINKSEEINHICDIYKLKLAS